MCVLVCGVEYMCSVLGSVCVIVLHCPETEIPLSVSDLCLQYIVRLTKDVYCMLNDSLTLCVTHW